MTGSLAATAQRGAVDDADSDIVAVVLRLGGCRYDWRTPDMEHDTDVAVWADSALRPTCRDYASLSRSDLLAIRVSRPG